MIGLVSECAEKLRAACLVDEDDSSHHGRPLEVSVLVPAMKTVVENLVQEHEETCGQLRREIERLEMEKAALEVAAREHMGALEVAQEQALRVAREDALLVGQRRQEELERMEMELDASRVAGEAATVELMKAREDLGEAIQLLEDRDRGYRRMCQENRMLHEMIKELRGNMLIYTRVRPRGVTGDGSECVVRCREEECALEFKNKHGDWKNYRFDRVFGENSTQEDVYMEATSLVRSVMAGTNVTIFAYGQTGSGKTHTMQYLNHKALEDLFRHQREDEEDSTRRYRFKIQMLEIYNEQVNDMLEPSNKNLKVHHLSFRNEESMTRVPDARIVAVETIEDVQKILEHGSSNRRVGATKMNDRSSRSHLMFTVMVERMEENGEVKRGRLHLIDLAGSERLNRSGAEGERATEAKAINLSLSTLGRVLAGIAANQRHISFRDSKITQLLEDSLTGGHGKSKCMMFMHVAPEAPSGQETRSTLEFGKSVVENVVVSG